MKFLPRTLAWKSLALILMKNDLNEFTFEKG